MDRERFERDVAERSEWTARFEDRLVMLSPRTPMVEIIKIAAQQYGRQSPLTPEEAAEAFHAATRANDDGAA